MILLEFKFFLLPEYSLKIPLQLVVSTAVLLIDYFVPKIICYTRQDQLLPRISLRICG